MTQISSGILPFALPSRLRFAIYTDLFSTRYHNAI